MALLEHLLSAAFIERLGWTLIHFVWQAAAVAVLLALVLKTLRKRSASARYITSYLALMLIIALPLTTMALLEVSEPVAEAGLAPAPVSIMEATPIEMVEVAELTALTIDPALLETPEVAVRAPWTRRAAAALEPALPYLVLGWLLGVFGLSAWHLGGWAQLQRMRRRMISEVAAPLHTKLRELAQALGVRRAVAMLESTLVEVPTVVGWIKPVILLPVSVLSGLSADQLEAILAHELAHIHRYDYLVNIVQTVIEILGFYHPALWWISHKIRAERENCCDDLAVQVCGDSVRYARALTCLEEMRHHRSELAVAASGGSLAARIGRLLGRPAVDNRRFTWLPGLIALLLVGAIVVPTALVLAAPEPNPRDALASESAVQEDSEPEAEEDEAPRAQILIDFILADVFCDRVMDRDTAEQAREYLKHMPAGTITTPSVEELQRPLGEVLSDSWAEMGNAEDFLDLLVSRGYAEVFARPHILQFAGQSASIRYGDRQDPNDAALSLDILPHVDGQVILLEMEYDRRYPTSDPEVGAPDIATSGMIGLIAEDGQDALMTTWNEFRDADGNKRRFVLVARPEITFDPGENEPPEQPDAEPAAAPAVRATRETPESEEVWEDRPLILTETIFANVQADKILDRPTRDRLVDILASRSPDLVSRQNLTVRELLHDRVVGKHLPPATIKALVDLLQAGDYLEIESRPQVQHYDNVQAEIRVGSEEYFVLSEDPNMSPQAIEAGTVVQVTPHVSSQAPDRITLEIAAQWTEPVRAPQTGMLLEVRTSELVSTVTVPRDQYFSFLLEPDRAAAAPAEDSQAKLILFKADRVATAGQPEPPSAPGVLPNDDPLRQVLLDVQVIELEKNNLLDLSVEWGFPQVNAGPFGTSPDANDVGGWPWGIEIGYTPDRQYTNAMQAVLRRLEEEGKATVVSNPQVMAQEGKEAKLNVLREEYYMLKPPANNAGSSHSTTEMVTIESGTKLAVTPQIADNNDITLTITTEVSNAVPSTAGTDLPVVTRRTARNVVTLQDGGTVVLAGLAENRSPGTTRKVPVLADLPLIGGLFRIKDRQGRTRELAVFVTAQLVSGDAPLPRNESDSPSLPLFRRRAIADSRATALDLAGARLRAETIQARREYVNSDPMVRELAMSLAQMQRELIEARQTLAPDSPLIARKEKLLEAFKEALGKKRQELEGEFDAGLRERLKPRRQRAESPAEQNLPGVAQAPTVSPVRVVPPPEDAETSPDRRQVRLDVRVAEVLPHETLDRDTAVRVRAILTDAGKYEDSVVPTVEELEKPLWDVLNECTSGRNLSGDGAKAFTDLLVAKGYGTIQSQWLVPTYEGQPNGMLIRADPNSYTARVSDRTGDFSLKLQFTPTIQGDLETIQLSLGIQARNPILLRDTNSDVRVTIGQLDMDYTLSWPADAYTLFPLPLGPSPSDGNPDAKATMILLLVKPTIVKSAPSVPRPVTESVQETRFLHTDQQGRVDREFGFDEMVQSAPDRWFVANPYLDLSLPEGRCQIKADQGQVRRETESGRPAPGDMTFVGNVVVEIATSEPNDS